MESKSLNEKKIKQDWKDFQGLKCQVSIGKQNENCVHWKISKTL